MLQLTQVEYIDHLIKKDSEKNFLAFDLPLSAGISLYGNPENKRQRRLLRSTTPASRWMVRLFLEVGDIIAIRQDRLNAISPIQFYRLDAPNWLVVIPPLDCGIHQPIQTFSPTDFSGASWSYMALPHTLFETSMHRLGFMLEHAHIPSVIFEVEGETPRGKARPIKSDVMRKHSSLEYWVNISNGGIHLTTATEKVRPDQYLGSVQISYKYAAIRFIAKDQSSLDQMRELAIAKLTDVESPFCVSIADEQISLRAYLLPRENELINITDKVHITKP